MPKRLTRNTDNAVLGGVAAGIADYFDIDPVLVRIGFVLLCLMGGGGLILYLICWVVMPERTRGAGAPGDRMVGEMRQAGERVVDGFRASETPRRGQMIAGAILIFLGCIFLLDRFSWVSWLGWLNWSGLWPLVLIAFGIGILLKRGHSPSEEPPAEEAR